MSTSVQTTIELEHVLTDGVSDYLVGYYIKQLRYEELMLPDEDGYPEPSVHQISDEAWQLSHEDLLYILNANYGQCSRFEDDVVAFYAMPPEVRKQDEDDNATPYHELWLDLAEAKTTEDFAAQVASRMVNREENVPLIVVDVARTHKRGFVPLVRAIREVQERFGHPPVRVYVHSIAWVWPREFELPSS